MRFELVLVALFLACWAIGLLQFLGIVPRTGTVKPLGAPFSWGSWLIDR